MKLPALRAGSCWAAALIIAISSSMRCIRPAEAHNRLELKPVHRDDAMLPRRPSLRIVSTSSFSHGISERDIHSSSMTAEQSLFGTNRVNDRNLQECNQVPEEETTVFDTVDFEVDGTICGTREEVASGLEAAFLEFFRADQECGSDLDVQSLVLVEFFESETCSEDEGYRGRDLQNTQPSRGRLNRVSSTRRRRSLREGRSLKTDGTDASQRDLAMNCGPDAVWNEEFEVCAHKCDPEGCPNPCTEKAINKGELYHVYCESEYKFVQCDLFGGCFVMPCGPGTKWGQAEQTCVHDDGGPVNRVPEVPVPEVPACPPDLAATLRAEGFEGVEFANITSIQVVDCFSSESQDCSSESGVCCGAPGCTCSFPSESLCEAEDGCIGQARPFEADFCEEFGWDTDACEICDVNRVSEPVLCDQVPDEETTVFDIVYFEVDDAICGTREEVASSLEAAFLAFFEVEADQCGSGLDVQSLVLVEFIESESCSEGEGDGWYRGRGLQNTQPSRGRLNRKSSTRRRRSLREGRSLKAQGSSASPRDLAVNCGPNAVWNEEYKICTHKCDPEGCSNPCTEEAITKGELYHVYCQNEYKFVQCDLFGGCFVMPCGPGTKWGQVEQTCVHDDGEPVNRVPAVPACPADLAASLRAEGFEGVEFANITSIQVVDCFSPYQRYSQECSSESGVCCGVPGCACGLPSESLCEAEEGCIGQARPFEADFCEEFGWDTDACEICVVNEPIPM